MSIYISLGSNISNRLKNLDLSVELIKKKNIKILDSSKIYETTPMDNINQPLFLNQVLLIDAILMPMQLLIEFKKIEKKMGREDSKERYLPRVIDIDILVYKNFIFQNSELTLPHPKIKFRKFILKPWTDIDPLYILPTSNTTIKGHLELINNSKDLVEEYKL